MNKNQRKVRRLIGKPFLLKPISADTHPVNYPKFVEKRKKQLAAEALVAEVKARVESV